MITKRVDEIEANPFDLSAVGHRCFFCGEFLVDPAVMWSGNNEKGQQIYLHGECVLKWQPGLMRDGLELRHAGRPCWNQLDKGERDTRSFADRA